MIAGQNPAQAKTQAVSEQRSGRAIKETRKQGDTITEARACECLADHIAKVCTPALTKIPTWVKMNSNQQSALYSFAYNLGAGFYQGANFTSITAVCDSPDRWNDSGWIDEQFGKYTNHGLEGLVRRRTAEATLFCTPV